MINKTPAEIATILVLTQDEACAKATVDEYKHAVNTESNHYEYLEYICRELEPQIIAELGTHLGVSCLFMKTGYPEAKIYTVDNNLIKSDKIGYYAKLLDNVTFLEKSAVEAVNDLPDGIELLFVDEEKYPEHLQRNLELYYPKMAKNGVIFFDDIFSPSIYPDSYKWWMELKGYTKITLPLIHKGYGFGAIIKE